MTESKLTSRIKTIVTLAVVFLGVLILGVIYTTIEMQVSNSRATNLKTELDRLTELTADMRDDIDYFNNKANLEEIARKYLGWGKKGETIFVYI